MPIALGVAGVDPIAIGSQLAELPAVALLIILVVVIAVGAFRKWWVFGWLFEERTRERDEARAEVAQLRLAVSKLTTRLSRERPQRSTDEPDGR